MADSIGQWVHVLSESSLGLRSLSLALAFGRILKISSYSCPFITQDFKDPSETRQKIFVFAPTPYEPKRI